MFKFLKDKLKKAVSNFSKEVKKEKVEEMSETQSVSEHDQKSSKKISDKPEEIKEEKPIEKEIEEETKAKAVKAPPTPPLIKITYFVHGTTTDNEKELATGWNPGELSELGKKQSIELREKIKDKFDIIFCSDLKRAVDSAELTFQDKVIIQDKRLRECNYGDLNGTNRKEVEYLESVDKSFPSGESLKDVEKRIVNFLNELFEKYKGKHVAIVSHRAPQLALDVLLKGKTWQEAIDEDWRLKGEWQPGWDYELKSKIKIKPKKSIFEKIKERVTKTIISEKNFNKFFDELEIILLENNVAVEVIEKIKNDLNKEIVDKPLSKGKVEEIIKENLKKSVDELFDVEKINLLDKVKENHPFVICFVGINGSGKTTSIAKVANYLMKNNLSCVLAAADTFRAASIEQLQEHADKLKIKMIKHDYGSDPAAVAFDAIKYAKAKSIDVVLIDTAGRMHSNVNLQEEMKKIIRVSNPDLKIFVGESITGNDCVEQARKFNDAINIDGIILTKADVDEKGGASISVSYVTGKPIMFLGVGQHLDDFIEFDSKKIVENII